MVSFFSQKNAAHEEVLVINIATLSLQQFAGWVSVRERKSSAADNCLSFCCKCM